MPSEPGQIPDNGNVLAPYRRLAPAGLPCCIRPILQVLFFDMLAEDDGFVDTIRKGGVMIGLVIGILSLLAAASLTTEADVTQTSVAIYASFIVVMAIGWIGGYVAVRCGKASALRALMCAMALTIVGLAASVPATAEDPQFINLLQVVIASALFNLPCKWAWFGTVFFPYVASAYNFAAKKNQYDFDPLLISGAADTEYTASTRVSPFVTNYLMSVTIAVVVYAMHDEYDRRIEASRASETLASLVAHQLGSYNTEIARELLTAAAIDATSAEDPAAADDVDDESGVLASVRGADPALVASLETIVANLEAYRPHLPNWMLDAAMDDAKRDSDDHEPSIASRRSTSTRRSRDSTTASGLKNPDGSGSAFAVTPRHHPTGNTAGGGAAVRTLVVARVCLHFRCAFGVDDRAALADASSAFVDAVHAAARGTKAAVHSFVGDSVEVSWNAAASVAAPAAKAVRFMARVRSAVVAAPPSSSGPARDPNSPTTSTSAPVAALRITVGGGAIACKAHVQMAGRGMQQALLLSVSPAHEATLATLAAAGLEHGGAMLATAAVAAEALDVESCPVATVRDEHDASKFAAVHQVLSEAAAASDNDEWLYVLQQRSFSHSGDAPIPTAAVSVATSVARAFCAAVDADDVLAARAALLNVDPARLTPYPLMLRFAQVVDARVEMSSGVAQTALALCL